MNFSCFYFIIIHLMNLCICEPQLKLLNVIFRHGDRTPTANAMFPNDPYYESNFYPYGKGALTRGGKTRVFELGKLLREKYNSFLGDIYLPEILEARSTDYDRTKMSLQVILAALFPPVNVQKWHDTLDWQPIPTTYDPKLKDDLLAGIHQPKHFHERSRVSKEPNIKKRIEDFKDFMTELTNLTGKNITDSLGMKHIYDTLTCEKFMNLTLPDWTDKIFPNGKLLEGILLDYDIVSYDKKITSSLSGKLMLKITTDMLNKKLAPKEHKTKLFLYSSHDVNVVAVLKSLNVYKTHVPEYTSAVIIELLEENNKYFIKVLYYRGIPPTFEELQIPGCSPRCPIENFVENLNEILELAKLATHE